MISLDDYITRSRQHAPQDFLSLAAEVRRLHAAGWRPAAISEAIGVSVAAVLQLLEPEVN